ncbi:MAG: non-heme iron oxygenase ferredoxin subunit [Deltaproteobacteria bacterium]|nr:non-heme iron oxygenase ferredoxin subunit [Deltaproteobacteria bacterium]
MKWQRVASVREVAPGEVKSVRVSGIDVALCNLAGSFHAVSNVCTHAYACLSDGYLEGDELECALHGGRFDVKTGAAGGGIVTEDLRRFAVRVEGDDVFISLGDGDAGEEV